MSGLVQIQHGTCINSAVTSGYLYVTPEGAVRCSRGCEDVPTIAEIIYSNREDREQIVEHHDGGLYVQTED